jgi:hypothetical protein
VQSPGHANEMIRVTESDLSEHVGLVDTRLGKMFILRTAAYVGRLLALVRNIHSWFVWPRIVNSA